MSTTPQKRFEVYTVIESGNRPKPFWLRLGSAFENRDGSINVYLEALPVNGKLQLRVPNDREPEAKEVS